jgi:hypothetical protein
MKVLLVSLLAFLFAFFLGCQESSVTDPATIEDAVLTIEDVQNLAYKDLISYYPEIIELNTSVYDPSHHGRKYTDVKGFIRYNHKLFKYETPKQPVRFGAQVKLYINTDLFPDCPNANINKCMKVVALENETVYFEGLLNHAKIVENKFRVCNCCCCPIDLYVKFAINRSEVRLISLEIQKCGWTPIGEEM